MRSARPVAADRMTSSRAEPERPSGTDSPTATTAGHARMLTMAAPSGNRVSVFCQIRRPVVAS